MARKSKTKYRFGEVVAEEKYVKKIMVAVSALVALMDNADEATNGRDDVHQAVYRASKQALMALAPISGFDPRGD